MGCDILGPDGQLPEASFQIFFGPTAAGAG